jgi:hypothetical protein
LSENENENADDLFGDLIGGLEDQFNEKILEKKSTFAVACARVTGTVFTEAVASGVPAELAQDMATDTWMSLMGFQMPQIISVTATDEE